MTSWYETISVYSSDYEPATFTPGTSVEANHDLLAGLRENDFDLEDISYTLGLLALSIVFLVCGVLACVLVPCVYKCLGTSRKERLLERLHFGKQTQHHNNLIMVVASVAAIATSAGAVWGLHKADSGLANIESATQQLATDLLAVLDLPGDTANALDQMLEAYDALQDSIDSCEYLSLLDLDAFDLDSFGTEIQNEIDAINEETVGELAEDVQGVSDGVGTTEGVRKGLVWPALVLAFVFTAIFVAISVGSYQCFAFGLPECGTATCFITPCTIFIAVVIWLCAASAVALSAMTGDFCIDPDTNSYLLVAEASDSDEITQLVTYYTTDCTTENIAVDAIIAAQEIAVPLLESIVPIIYQMSDACSDLSATVESLDSSLQSFWTILEDAGELTSCENLNGLYQSAVYGQLCSDVPKGLLGFWVSCSFLTVLLLILVVQWSKMLRWRTTEDDAAIVEEMNRRRAWRQNASRRFSTGEIFSNFSSRNGGRKPIPLPSEGGAQPPAAAAASVDVSNRSEGRWYGVADHPPAQRPVVIDRPQHAIGGNPKWAPSGGRWQGSAVVASVDTSNRGIVRNGVADHGRAQPPAREVSVDSSNSSNGRRAPSGGRTQRSAAASSVDDSNRSNGRYGVAETRAPSGGRTQRSAAASSVDDSNSSSSGRWYGVAEARASSRGRAQRPAAASSVDSSSSSSSGRWYGVADHPPSQRPVVVDRPRQTRRR